MGGRSSWVAFTPLAALFCAATSCKSGDSGTTDDPNATPVQTDDRIEKLGRCADFNPLREPFFGDTHVHTRLSLDANLQGNRLAPIDAYRFARGEEVGIQPYGPDGEALRRLKISRPLDFVALSDHAEFLGVVQSCTDPAAAGYDTATCVKYRDDPDGAFIPLNSRLAARQGNARAPAPCDPDEGGCTEAELSAWREVQEAAEAAYDRSDACSFTSFVAYEWSGSPGALNLHRNVIFRNHVVPHRPWSYFDDNQEQALWRSLQSECLDATDANDANGSQGACDVLTIPHNSNLSSGLIFETLDENGAPIDAAYAQVRAAFEPLVEIFQHKGDSECLPDAATTPASDEFCDFEKVPYSTLAAANLGGRSQVPFESDFVRDALGVGLLLGKSLGTNPFQYGIIASTDTHMGTPGAVEEDAFIGHGGAGITVRDALPPGLPDLWHERYPHRTPALRRLGLQRKPLRQPRLRQGGLRRRRADGRDARCGARRHRRAPFRPLRDA